MDALEDLDLAIKHGPIHSAKDMLRMIVADHQKSELRAGVFREGRPALGLRGTIAPGECAYCGNSDMPLLRDEPSTRFGARTSVHIHIHEDPNPSCIECADADRDEPWPCAFLRRIAEHYEVEL